MQIGEVAQAAGVSPKAIRYYEALGLVPPTRRDNGYRDYDEHQLRVVQELRSLARLGIPLTRARPFVDCLNAGRVHADECPASMAEYQSAIDALDDQIRQLSARRQALAEQLLQAASGGGSARHEEGPDMTNLTVLPGNLPVPEDDGGAAHLPGAPMPDLTLPADHCGRGSSRDNAASTTRSSGCRSGRCTCRRSTAT
ncbi:MerR family DNA-binding transcriptional regulator [Micromonospora sp. NBC_00898]|uniref:MerR family DNA-binding transcriptional regulator n=1 Tax=Micromonospora sp. NBC_00898 TaxID=2975981 RepID=UPI003870E153|nr:MerR family DNA-binding transcriptional regulator [Micromonospora sp. NBC_00898]